MTFIGVRGLSQPCWHTVYLHHVLAALNAREMCRREYNREIRETTPLTIRSPFRRVTIDHAFHAQIVVSYATGTIFSGLLSLKLTVRASRGWAGIRFNCCGSPDSLAFCCLAKLDLTRFRKSSREREWRTCSTRTLMRFSR
jgi:hypothetical protein